MMGQVTAPAFALAMGNTCTCFRRRADRSGRTATSPGSENKATEETFANLMSQAKAKGQQKKAVLDKTGDPQIRITIDGDISKRITLHWPYPQTTVDGHERKCIVFVVSCQDMDGLRELWINYLLGKLKKFFQDLFSLEASLASDGSENDLDLDIRIDPEDFYSCRRHLQLTCATKRGFRVVNLKNACSRVRTKLGLSEDYPVYCKPLLQRTTCSQLDFLDPAMPTDQLKVTGNEEITCDSEEVTCVSAEVTWVSDEVTWSKEEVTWVSGEVIWHKGESKGEVTWVSGEVTWHSGEVTWSKREVTWVSGEVTWHNGEVTWSKGEVNWVNGEVARRKGEVTWSKGEITCGKIVCMPL
ncbi:Hypp4545 [Branchiostoma lanceolatum]|uniref:Hypp4545 protein n=1 Tax=Branchiostoma lanceolatum TaxID=7740 RepID=A0A8K0AE48_BRALA|nr:Hypp4545 [Branchiostoma lanceolatum]